MDYFTLPNGLKIANVTPHEINFWRDDWDDVVIVPVHRKVDAAIKDKIVALDAVGDEANKIEFVTPEFLTDSQETIDYLLDMRAQGVYPIGSIIAAQAYPELVFAMVPCEGYERVPPAEKRMRPDKFTMYLKQGD